MNIHPDEINEVIASHPDVEKSKTIGIPNEFFGEQIKSYVILKKNCCLSEKDLKVFCAKYLSPIKIPDFIEIVNEFPISPTG